MSLTDSGTHVGHSRSAINPPEVDQSSPSFRCKRHRHVDHDELQKPLKVQRREHYVGGRFPDRWSDYSSSNSYFSLEGLPIKGIIPCKTFLDHRFDYCSYNPLTDDFIRNNACSMPWTPLNALHLWHREESPLSSEDGEDGSEKRVAARNPERNLETVKATELPQIAAVVNLCLTERYYYPADFASRNTDYYWFPTLGRGEVPAREDLYAFVELIYTLGLQYPGRFVVLHCTHGVNRTGFFSVLLLMLFNGLSVKKAVEVFRQARGHTIERECLLTALHDIEETLHKENGLFQFCSRLTRPLNANQKLSAKTGSHCSSEQKLSSRVPVASSIIKLGGISPLTALPNLYLQLLRQHHSATKKPVPLSIHTIRWSSSTEENENREVEVHFCSDVAAKAFCAGWETTVRMLDLPEPVCLIAENRVHKKRDVTKR